jgi:membrane protease YdiL (CAAX protease family)
MRDTIKQMWRQLGLGLLNFVVVLALVFVLQALIHRRVSGSVGLTILSGVVLAAYFAGSRWIERRRPTELEGSRAIPELAGGIGMGIALFSVVMGLLGAFGLYHPTGRGGTVAALGSGFLIALLVAIFEETVARGFLFRLIQIAGGTWIAVVISSAMFGAAHAFNPGATLTSSIAIALEAGVLLAAAYIVTGRLWFPIGIHAGWNFAEGSLFGMAVSGGAAKSALITGTLTGPVILTGGAFGPEASVLAVVVCVVAAVLLLRRAARSGLLVHPPWSRAVASGQSPATGLAGE